MSKRVAYIFKGCASYDESSKPLEYLDDNVEKITEVLEENGAWDVKCFDLDYAETLKSALNDVMEVKGIDEFLFYYTGHGKGIKDYYLIGEQEKRINLLDAISLHDTYTQKVSIIIDACESHTLIEKWNNEIPYELLVATKKEFAYEGNLSNMSDFSHCFHEAFYTVTKDTFKLKDIHENMKGKLPKQESDYSPIKSRERSVIGFNKEINEIQKTLKTLGYKKVKEKASDYFNPKLSSYDDFIQSQSFDELFKSLLLNKECLFCLLKALGEDCQKVKKIDDDFNCLELKTKVQENQEITAVILKIEMENNDLSRCHVNSWLKLSNETYQPRSFSSTLMDFSKGTGDNAYVIKLTEYLKEKVLLNQKPQAQLEVQLMLPYKLFNIDFDNLKFHSWQKWNRAFNISKRFLTTYEEYTLGEKLQDLKENSKKSFNARDNLIRNLDQLKIENESDKSKIDRYNDKDKNYILMTSNYNLTDEPTLMEIQYYGIPHILTPSKTFTCTCIDFKESKIKEINNELFAFAKDHRESCIIHIIYNNYYDLEFLTQKEI